MSENEVLEHFDNLFDTNVKEHITLNMPLLNSIVDKLCELPTMPSPTYKAEMKKQIELSDKIRDLLTDEGKNLFEEYKRKRKDTERLTDEQLFCFGYIFAKELDREGKLGK